MAPQKWTIPAVPRGNNRALRAHWSVRKRDRDNWQRYVNAICGRNRNPPARVRIILHVHRIKRQDKDNSYGSVKPLVDALVSAGWARDDDREHLVLKVMETPCRKYKFKKTEIYWEEL